MLDLRQQFFERDDVKGNSWGVIRRKLREAKMFAPIEKTKRSFLEHFLDGRDTDQNVKGGTGTSKTHQIISQVIAKGVNDESPFGTVLITGK